MSKLKTAPASPVAPVSRRTLVDGSWVYEDPVEQAFLVKYGVFSNLRLDRYDDMLEDARFWTTRDRLADREMMLDKRAKAMGASRAGRHAEAKAWADAMQVILAGFLRLKRQGKSAASKPRPGARSSVRARMLAMMKRYKADSVSFDAFLEGWIVDKSRENLLIEEGPAGAGYVVVDEDDPQLRAKNYTRFSLRTIYSAA